MPVALNFRSYGEAGEPIIILHGLFGSAVNWGTVARHLAADHRVWVPDLRNHGRSPHRPRMDYPAMAEDVWTLMDDQGLEQATLVGHSMGGKLAMTLALTLPARVRRLVVVDIAPVAYPIHHAPILAALRALDLTTVRGRGDAEAALAPTVRDRRARQFLLQNLSGGPEGWRWRLNLAAIADNLPALSGFPPFAPGAAYHGPCLFVAGAESDYLQAGHRPVLEARFPQAEVTTIAGAGHWLHAEQPVLFLKTLSQFLQRPAA